MIAIAFKKGETCKSTYQSIYQYDYGQVLRIQGLNLPPAVEVHFSLQNTGGEATIRIGVTKDGVTDAVIPDSLLENGDIAQNYEIYAFVYLRNETSGQTEYKITMHVTSRPKPEAFDRPEDAEIFKEAIKAVNDSAARSAESEKQAEGWAHGREDLPERTQDNAKYYAGKTEKDAEKTATDRKEVERLVESVSGIDEQVEKVDGLTKQAQKAATDAGLYKEAAESARKGAETAKTEAETAAGKTAEDKTAVETAKSEVLKAQETVSTDRKAVESIKSGIEQLGGEIAGAVGQGMQELGAAKQQAVQEIGQTGTEQKSVVESSGTKAVQSIENIKQTATEAVETAKTEAVQAVQTEGTAQTGKVSAEGKKQVQAVQQAAQEIVADREQIQTNKADIALLKDIAIVEKASGKTIIIEDASNFPAESLNGTGKIIITGKNIIDTEKRKVFIPFSAETGTTFTLITNGQPSNGGNVKFIAVDGSEIWCPIDKGKKKVTFTLRKDAKGFYNILSPGESLKYCFSVGKNDKYEEYTEQILNAPISPEQLRNAHTNYPYTVLTSENEIAVEYVADTKLYIDKKLKQLVTANQSHTANLLSLMPMEIQAAMIENDTNRILESEITQ